MSKVDTYIKEHTRNYSNETRVSIGKSSYWKKQPWLTPDDAIEVAKIAREEAIEDVCEWLNLNLEILLKVLNIEYNIENDMDVKEFIEDLKEAVS